MLSCHCLIPEPLFKRYKDELAHAQENIKEFQFIDGIETLDDLKQMINTCHSLFYQLSNRVFHRLG